MLNLAADNPVQYDALQCVFIEFVKIILELVKFIIVFRFLTRCVNIVANLIS